MAGSLQKYAFIFVSANGTLLAEEHNVSVIRDNKAQPVSTVAKGYAGDSPGAGMVEIQVRNAIPVGGPEFDMGRFIAGNTPIDVQVQLGGKVLSGQCNVYRDEFSHGVNTEAGYQFSARMPIALFA